MGELSVYKTVKGNYAVRPKSWAGIWNKNRLLDDECRYIACFSEEKDADDYVTYRAQNLTPWDIALLKAKAETFVDVVRCKDCVKFNTNNCPITEINYPYNSSDPNAKSVIFTNNSRDGYCNMGKANIEEEIE